MNVRIPLLHSGSRSPTSALAICLCVLTPVGNAATVNWVHNGSTDWETATNWSTGTTPGSSDNVNINQAGAQGPLINGGNIAINSLSVGDTANGTLFINNGGQLTTADGSYIGSTAGVNANVTVSGTDSVWELGRHLYLGHKGNGSLIIENGATVNQLTSNIFMGMDNPGGTDFLSVSGAGSSLNLNDWLLVAYANNNKFHNTTSIVEVRDGAQINAVGVDVGYGGHGILTISGGGSVVTQDGLISPYEGSKGDVLITGQGSRWSITNDLNIAHQGNGTVVISDGGLLENNNGFVSAGAGSLANIIVTGTDSRWNNSDSLILGYQSDAELTISNGGVVSADNAVIVAYNADSAGTLNIGAAAGQTATAPGTLTTAEVYFGLGDGRLVFNHTAQESDRYAFSSIISGDGTVNSISGVTTLTASNTYSGSTLIDGGTLKAGNENTFSPNSEHTVNTNGSLDLAGFNQQVAKLDLAGSIYFNGRPGTVLTVANSYSGNHGVIAFNTQLGGDTSATDKLIVNGDTSGETRIIINNVGGYGALTDNGIEIISVNGQSDGNFTLENRAVAGVYEYFLYKNASGTKAGNWYLSSSLPTSPDKPIIRAESGSYLANIADANSIFNLRLEDREGRTENSSMWLRQFGSHTRFRDNSGQLYTQSNRYVIQGGGEVFDAQFTQDDRLGLGVMFGYGNTNSNTNSHLSGKSSKGSVNGYTAGLYSTWYQDAKTLDGLYVDSWLQYSWLEATVNGQQLSSEHYNIDGLSASVESGYRKLIYQGQNGDAFMTPQAQIIWSGISADKHTESNGTVVESKGKNSIQTRLGIKLSREGVHEMDRGKDRLFTVYTEANWIHNNKQTSALLNGVKVSQTGTRHIGELKLGLEGQINKQLNIWTNVAQQVGEQDYRNTAVTVGVKYRF